MSYSVALLSGGDSWFRDESLASGRLTAVHLRRAGNLVRCFDPAEIGLGTIPWNEFDLCFISLYGGAAHDGRIQRRLESLGVCFTGNGSEALERASHTLSLKARLQAGGLATLPCRLLSADMTRDEMAAEVELLGYPVGIRPEGRTAPVASDFADNADELLVRLRQIFRFEPAAVVEPWVDGREFLVVVEGGRAWPIVEIVSPRGVMDFDEGRETVEALRTEAGLTIADRLRLKRTALHAAEALGAASLTLTKLIVDRKDRIWVAETDLLPSLSLDSPVSQLLPLSGRRREELCQEMVRAALRQSTSP